MIAEELSTSKAFQYSLILHVVFALILALSWGHVPIPEPVQVALWSSNEMTQAVQSSTTSPRPKTVHVAKPAPPVKIQKTTPIPEIRPEPKLSHRVKDFFTPKAQEESGDIQVERKPNKKPRRYHKVEEPVPEHPLRHESRHREEHRVEARQLSRPVTRPQPSPVKRPIERPDDKAEQIENMLDQPASQPHRQVQSRAERGEGEPTETAHRGGGHKGVDCSRLGGYCTRVRGKIKGNLEWDGDPSEVPSQAIVEVKLLPNGEIRSVTVKQSSGNRSFDEAVRRAILASSPLPRPESSDALPDNILNINYRP